MNIYVNAYLQSGRMVRRVRRKECTRNKKPAWTWEESSDCGGTYDDLYDWIRNVWISYNEPVRFELETDEPRPGAAK